MKIGPEVQIFVSNIVPARWRGYAVTRAKVELAIERIQREGFTAKLKGRYLPGGTVEQATGHNRITAAREIGYEEPITFQIYEDCTEEEFYQIYLTDNDKRDDQTTAWALNAVKSAPDVLGKSYADRGEPLSKMYSDIGKSMGLNEREMDALRQMNAAFDAKILAPEVADIFDTRWAIYLWRKLDKIGVERVSFSHQRLAIPLANDGDDRGIRKLFEGWENQLTKAPLVPKAPRGFESIVNSAIRALNEIASRPEDMTSDIRETLETATKFLATAGHSVASSSALVREELEILEA